MHDHIVAHDSLLEQVDVEKSVHHDLYAADTGTHVWSLLTQQQNELDGAFAKLRVLLVLGNRSNSLPEDVRQ